VPAQVALAYGAASGSAMNGTGCPALPRSRSSSRTARRTEIRIVEKSNWTGRAVVASRAQLSEALHRDELARPGVYVLTVSDESGTASLYVGEADVLGERLRNHASRKDFWTRFIAFSSTDENSTRRTCATWSQSSLRWPKQPTSGSSRTAPRPASRRYPRRTVPTSTGFSRRC
jgi:hypothetical protein